MYDLINREIYSDHLGFQTIQESTEKCLVFIKHFPFGTDMGFFIGSLVHQALMCPNS